MALIFSRFRALCSETSDPTEEVFSRIKEKIEEQAFSTGAKSPSKAASSNYNHESFYYREQRK